MHHEDQLKDWEELCKGKGAEKGRRAGGIGVRTEAEVMRGDRESRTGG